MRIYYFAVRKRVRQKIIIPSWLGKTLNLFSISRIDVQFMIRMCVNKAKWHQETSWFLVKWKLRHECKTRESLPTVSLVGKIVDLVNSYSSFFFPLSFSFSPSFCALLFLDCTWLIPFGIKKKIVNKIENKTKYKIENQRLFIKEKKIVLRREKRTLSSSI